MEIYDISQLLHEGMPVWPGDEEFKVRWSARIENGELCNVSSVTMSVHTGTHVETPYHFDHTGHDLSGAELGRYVGPARVVRLDARACIRASDLVELPWDGVQRVLFRTRPDGMAEDEWGRGFVYLTEDAAEFLGEMKMLLVGTDAPSIDAFESKTLGGHRKLSHHSVAILEGVRLSHVPPGDYDLVCLPLKLNGLEASPVRAILRK
jgi:arylformamidase